jgi:N-acetylneuraminate synthase
MRDLPSLYINEGDPNDPRENLGSQYTLDLLNRFELPPEEMFEAFNYCKVRGIMPLCTPWDIASLKLLETYQMDAYKVSSADMTNHTLLRALAKTGKPLIVSTGMSEEKEIEETVSLLKKLGVRYILLHCNSTYPAPFKDVNLEYLSRLKKIGDCIVGYSGHERGFHIPIAAVALGALVIEKHITLDKTQEGNDHQVSLLPDEFKQMVENIRQLEAALGTKAARHITPGERLNRANLAKSLVITTDLKKGELITQDIIAVKSPGRGLQPNSIDKLIGKTAKRNFKSGDFFYPSDLEYKNVQPKSYNFHRPWGLPVRYHDFKKLIANTNPDFLEFHLSYKDMDLDINSFFEKKYDLGLIVHSPDLFSGDHLLDLASENEAYRQRSIKELQRVVDITQKLKIFFKRAEKPLIVASLGGFTKNGFCGADDRKKMYRRLVQSLSQIDQKGVEIIAQTMPPFPWYFGGQL